MDERMTLDRFVAIVDAYGASPQRWPEAERDAAIAFMKATPEARRLAEEAEALDGLLDMPETAPVTRDLQDRILATMPAVKLRNGAAVAAGSLFNWSRWIPTAAVAFSLVLGILTGTQVPRLVGLDDETLALQVASSAISSSSDESEFLGVNE